MRVTKFILLSLFALSATCAPAQDLFRVRFQASRTSFDATHGHLVTRAITERNIIAQAVGLSAKDRTLLRNFALAYNTSLDTIQVVDTNGTPIVDVIHFGGGASSRDRRTAERFTFMFFPGQTNEFGVETNAIGTAFIREHALRATATNGPERASITGRVQFVLTRGNVLGMTNVLEMLATDAASLNALSNAAATPSGPIPNPAPGSQATTNLPASSGAGTEGFFMTSANDDPTAEICVGSFVASRGLTETGQTPANMASPAVTAFPGSVSNNFSTNTTAPIMQTNALPSFPGTSVPEVPTNAITGVPQAPVLGSTTNPVSGTLSNSLPPFPPSGP